MRSVTPFLSLVLAAGFAVSSAAVVKAQPEPVSVTPAREAKAMAFAGRHHPELAELLSRLKVADRQAYEKALREVSQNSERLAKMQDSDPDRYQLSLQVWTLDSRIRLLAARATMSNDPAVDIELRELLTERQNVRLSLFKLDRDRLEARLERLHGQIQQLQADPEGAVENDFVRIQREIKAAAQRERRASEQSKKAGSKPVRETNPKKNKPSSNGKETSRDVKR